MAIDNSKMITSVSLNQYLVDKNTGAPLVNGQLWFYKDTARTTPKLVYTKQNTGQVDPQGNIVYDFVPLSDPISLSGVGTIVDDNGNQIALYYYPFNEDTGSLELYYVVCYDYLGVLQFVREGWPDTFETDNPDFASGSSENLISNPQFVSILFQQDLNLSITIPASSVNMMVEIAPDWSIQASAGSSGNGAVLIERLPIAGSAALPTNPPYVLRVTPSGPIISLSLVQKFSSNPGIWGQDFLNNGGNVAVSILLGVSTNVLMQYIPNPSGTPQLLLDATNTTAAYDVFSDVVTLPASTDPSAPPAGFVNILLTLPFDRPSLFSSVQLTYLGANTTAPIYQQESVNRQRDHLFHYYEPILSYKSTPSYLTGWQFPLNPHQFLGPTITPKTATSYYAWDQTIVYQSAASSVNVTQSAIGGLRLTAVNPVKVALVQYMPAVETGIFGAINALINPLSVMVSCYSSVNINSTVTIMYTNGVLPSTIASGISVVGTLDANGALATTAGASTWYALPRSNLGNATFTSTTSALIPYVQHGFSGWQFPISSPPIPLSTVEYVAVIVGTGTIPAGEWIEFGDISMCSGHNPTMTQAQPADRVLLDCSAYYASSFMPGIIPAQASGLINGYVATYIIGYGGAVGNQTLDSYTFPVPMWTTPTAITTYNPQNADRFVVNTQTGVSCSNTTTINNNNTSFFLSALNSAAGIGGFNYTADARLGQ